MNGNETRQNLWELCGLATLFVIAVWLVNPAGNFPLDDDWNFALSSWHFADTGHFRFARFTAMTLKLQVLWGALWTVTFGKSFEVLRASTLLLSFGTLLLLNAVLRRAEVTRNLRLLAVVAFFVHPIFFWCSFTYMTHVPFIFLSVAAFYCFLRGLRSDSHLWVTTGILFTFGSCFIRQTGIANILPPLVYLLLFREVVTARWRSRALLLGGGLLLFTLLFLTTTVFQGYPGTIGVHFKAFEGRSVALLLALNAYRYVVMTFQFLAVFTLPLLILLFRKRFSPRELLGLLLVAAPLLWFAADAVGRVDPFPYSVRGNVLSNVGLGPRTLSDVWLFGYRYPFHLDAPALAVLTYLVTFAAAFLLWRFGNSAWRLVRREERHTALNLALIHTIVSVGTLVLSGIYFDRYVLDVTWTAAIWMPLLAIRAGTEVSRKRFAMAFAALLLLAFFSIWGTSEYLAWNRARWVAFAWLQQRGVPLSSMDGGYEINQYLIGGFDGPLFLKGPGMSVIDNEYLIAFNVVRGYEKLQAFPFRGRFGPGRELYVLKRTTGFRPEFDLPDRDVRGE